MDTKSDPDISRSYTICDSFHMIRSKGFLNLWILTLAG